MAKLTEEYSALVTKFNSTPIQLKPMEVRQLGFFRNLDGNVTILDGKYRNAQNPTEVWYVEFKDKVPISLSCVKQGEDTFGIPIKYIVPIVVISQEEMNAQRELAREARHKLKEQRKAQQAVKAPDWDCPICTASNVASVGRCYRCGEARPLETLKEKLAKDDQKKLSLLDRLKGKNHNGA